MMSLFRFGRLQEPSVDCLSSQKGWLIIAAQDKNHKDHQSFQLKLFAKMLADYNNFNSHAN